MNEFYLIETIISNLKKQVNLYQSLYGEAESVDKLNSSAYADIFSTFQLAMFYEIVCRISALFDPSKMRYDKNLTLDHLVELCNKEITKDLVLEVESVKYDFKQTGIKAVRNKAYAHYDLKRYLGKKELATNISYDILSKLLNDLFIIVRKLGLQSGMVHPDQTISRDTNFKKGKDGESLISKVTSEK